MGTIIVTGAAGILGKAVLSALEAEGQKAVGVDLAPNVPGGFGGIDLTDEAAVQRCYTEIGEKHGPISGLANIAGGFLWELMVEGSPASFDRMYQMNLRSAAVSCHAVLPHIEPGGSIVNVGAAAAAVPGAGMAPYAASKAGVRALTESLADELSGRPVRVNAVLPTILDTPTNRKDMPDADRSDWVTPEAAADAVAFLLSDAARAVTGASLRLALGDKT
jgi:NAD(P)-dependent dehydrogenase (short-subunit alcohol dehydrogenase family)